MKPRWLLANQALYCAIALIVSMLIIHPSARMGVGDDFAYVRTAKFLADTGRLDYFGWAQPILGWQLLIGALFIKLFGFSYNIVRASMFCIALALTLLLHPTFVRCGLQRRNATFATLTIVLSPIFLPLAYIYMSDMPGFFAIVLCLYCCLRAVQANENKSAFRWIVFAAFSNVVAGTARQTAWLGVLVLVPSAFWLIRHRRPPIALAAAVWSTCILLILAIVHWFSHQLFSQPERLLDGPVNLAALHQLAASLLHFLLGLSLLLLPIFIAFFTGFAMRRLPVAAIVTGTVTVIAIFFLVGGRLTHYPLADWLAPFNRDFLTPRGMIDLPDLGTRPVVISYGIQLVITVVSLGATLSFLVFLWRLPPCHADSASNGGAISWHQLLVLTGPFAFAYLGLLLPRGAFELMRDRYVLALLLVVLILATRLYQDKIRPDIPPISFVCLAVFSMFGIAAAHDLFAMHRARVSAADELIHAGISPAAFYGGFEYDGNTQIDLWGYINDRADMINVPAGVPYRLGTMAVKPCGYVSAKLFAAIHPRYALSFSNDSCQGPSVFPAVHYHTWLPPYSGVIYVQNVASSNE